jgi:hypothetical protein
LGLAPVPVGLAGASQGCLGCRFVGERQQRFEHLRPAFVALCLGQELLLGSFLLAYGGFEAILEG